ncbi:putative dihydrolipoamide succinyltransferase [Dunaliella salina]|uniref:Dihydrolipoamide acetyltransferase component of pyruvate dehydrogenase complex n=1 Tax=Dunaliella salina TaxID=3046 RepID=A0ABQ7GUZ1_DUNSA|nr:putative dihydrolipoamide succinyltransferase [Dunaliella salina]|eukprot:KAF5838433.1 putative dihydrolipoamide succinyltransferase [Dunaliella salina]
MLRGSALLRGALSCATRGVNAGAFRDTALLPQLLCTGAVQELGQYVHFHQAAEQSQQQRHWSSSSSSSSMSCSTRPSSFSCHSPTPSFPPFVTQLRGFRSTPPASEPMKIQIPPMGESVSEGTVAAILKHPGDEVKEDDIIAQIETDKVTIDVKYQQSAPGVIKELLIKESDVVQVGNEFVVVDVGATGGSAAAAAPEPPAAAPQEPAPKAAPKAPEPSQAGGPRPPPPHKEPRRVAEQGYEASTPTTPQPPPPKPAPPPPPQPPSAPAAPAAPGARPERCERMGKDKDFESPQECFDHTFLHLLKSRSARGCAPQFLICWTHSALAIGTLFFLIEVGSDAFLEKHGVKLGFMSAFVKASAYALQEVPAVNGVIDGDEIVYRDYNDISIAVATPKGLVVPVLRNVETMNFAGVEKTINALGKKARDGTISIDDMAGGTFTISNGGVYGSLLSTPIINPPQSAILGMHSIVQRPMVVSGKIEARPMMYVALTYDHRLVDGREAVTFLKRIKEVVEDPRRFLLDC